jgi:glycosyltransferase involved in cell wall biosynthesis
MIAPTSFFADYGCHVRILEEARALAKLGHGVTICTYHNGRNLPDLDIRRTLSIPWRQSYEVGSSRHKIGFDLLLFMRALRAMWQVRPHIIHAHLHEGALIGQVLGWLWRVPLIFDFQGSLTGEMVDHHFLNPDGPFFRPMLRLERALDRASAHILTSSARARHLLTQEFGCDPERIQNVPDCVNTDTFQPVPRDEAWRAFKVSLGVPAERQVVVYLGLLAEYQGTSHLLRAMQRVCRERTDAHLVLGGYPNIAYYQGMAAELGISDYVTFTGQVPYEQAPRLLAVGDIAVSPKLSKTEGAGKLLNYMAMALPTVAFDTPVSREYLADHGVYAAPADDDALANALLELLAAPERREAIGAALRARAQRLYAWEDAARTITALYQQSLA